jgi:hypothetical protein
MRRRFVTLSVRAKPLREKLRRYPFTHSGIHISDGFAQSAANAARIDGVASADSA